MNEFTKEELSALRDSRCYHMDDSYPSNDPLFKKLQLMIDNYCDNECHHDWDGALITEKPNTGKCKKCGVTCFIAVKDCETDNKPQSIWIDAYEDTPDLLEKVLFHWIGPLGESNISMGYLSDSGWYIYLPYDSLGLSILMLCVTHWMPLPEYP